MFSSAPFLILLFALSVAASPIVVRENLVRLPFAKRVNATHLPNLLKFEQARAAAFRARRHGVTGSSALEKDAVVSVPVQNQAVSYVASVNIGTPPQAYSLLIDSGSSNTWVGAASPYRKTSSSVQTKDRVSVTYGSGSFSGTEFTDTVSLGPGLTIKHQSIGVASRSEGFDGVDGILGIGPVDLTLDTLSPDVNTIIPTVTDNLFSQGTISGHELSVSFEPTTQEVANNGELTFGGTDSSKFTGSITFAPLTTTSPANEFWGINQKIRYGTSTMILSETAGIVDTGSTLLLIATDALGRYKQATGAVEDNTTGLLRLTTAQFNRLQSLFFIISGRTFEFTANAQAWPRSLNTLIGGTSGNVYLIVNDAGANTGSGLDFINGFVFIERFYTVFDTANKRVGFATTPFTHANTN